MFSRPSRTSSIRPLILVVVLTGALATSTDAGSAAQARSAGMRRYVATVGALVTYPVFFHAHPVRVPGVVAASPEGPMLSQGDQAVLLVGRGAAGLSADPSSSREVSGTFVDVGRFAQNDPRIDVAEVQRLSQQRLGKPWPGVNELLLIAAESVEQAEPFPAPSVRALAMAPERYLDSRVSIVGRFRGRNLYGDQPDAPGRSRWDFVLQSADASIWVVNLRPRGQGFNLAVDSRVDTDRWLEINGVVRKDRNLVILDGIGVRLAQAPPEVPSEPVARVPTMGPRPEVVFSTPTNDETDVSLSARIRVQFSRGLDPESLKTQIRATYLGVQATERGEPQAPGVTFSIAYDEGNRTLEIRFPQRLERFRTIKVELLDGIKATDGAPLVPWTLTFSLGG